MLACLIMSSPCLALCVVWAIGHVITNMPKGG
jgi:hypothetical protein